MVPRHSSWSLVRVWQHDYLGSRASDCLINLTFSFYYMSCLSVTPYTACMQLVHALRSLSNQSGLPEKVGQLVVAIHQCIVGKAMTSILRANIYWHQTLQEVTTQSNSLSNVYSYQNIGTFVYVEILMLGVVIFKIQTILTMPPSYYLSWATKRIW